MSGDKILIIDDRRENLLFLADSVLRPEGYEVITAMDGKQGLDKALAEKPDLIITDLKMPNMDGIEFIDMLRRTSPEARILLVTGYATDDTREMAESMGASYLAKPFKPEELLKAVESLS